MKNVLVVGATGTVGLEVVNALVARGVKPRVLVRPHPGAPLHDGHEEGTGRGAVTRVVGELSDRGSLDRAFQGIDAAFFVTPHDAREAELGENVVRACEAAGVKRVVYSAALRPYAGNWLTLRIVHALIGLIGPHYRPKMRTERLVRASRLDGVVLLPSNFFQNDDAARDALRAGRYTQPIGSKPVNRVDVRDIAEAAVRALLEPEKVRPGSYAIVGPEEFTGESAATAWSAVLGREVRYAGDDVNAWAASMRGKMPEAKIADFARTFRVLQRWGVVPSERQREETAEVLGRRPRAFAEWAKGMGSGTAVSSGAQLRA